MSHSKLNTLYMHVTVDKRKVRYCPANRGVPAEVYPLLTLLLLAQLVTYLQVMVTGKNIVELVWLKKLPFFVGALKLVIRNHFLPHAIEYPPHSASSKGLLILCHTLVIPLTEQAQLIRFSSWLATLQCALSYQASHW